VTVRADLGIGSLGKPLDPEAGRDPFCPVISLNGDPLLYGHRFEADVLLVLTGFQVESKNGQRAADLPECKRWVPRSRRESCREACPGKVDRVGLGSRKVRPLVLGTVDQE
jgi:hypothetical protein